MPREKKYAVMARAVGGRSFQTHNSTLYVSGRRSMAAEIRPPQKTAAGLAGLGPPGGKSSTPASHTAERAFPDASFSTSPATSSMRQYAIGLDANTARPYASANCGPRKSKRTDGHGRLGRIDLRRLDGRLGVLRRGRCGSTPAKAS